MAGRGGGEGTTRVVLLPGMVSTDETAPIVFGPEKVPWFKIPRRQRLANDRPNKQRILASLCGNKQRTICGHGQDVLP